VIYDPTGSTVPGAEVRATQTDTGLVRTTTSAADGAYVLTNLPIGPYTLEIRKEGFNKYVQSGIVLQVNTNPTLDAALKVGSVSEQVTVEAGTALVETHSTGIGTVVDNQRVVELPLNGRDATQLIFLSGMASPSNTPQLRNFPATVVSVAGGQGNGVTYLLDGAIHNDVSSSLNLPLPFPDALQEFKVETSALSPQYGFHSAATVNAVTKSGTNQFHGDLFEFVRNGDFNARNFFATQRDVLKQNQFGGTVGGPVKKDKLFFFVGLQRRVTRSNPTDQSANIPTAAALQGDFRDLASADCNNGTVKHLNAKSGAVGDVIPGFTVNPVAAKIVAQLTKGAGTPDKCGKVFYGLTGNQNQSDIVGRMDYQLSAKHSLFGRVTTNILDTPSTYDGVNPLTLNTVAVRNAVYTLELGHTWLVSPSTVSAFHISASRTARTITNDNFYSWKDLGSNLAEQAGKTVRLTMTNGGFNLGSVNGVPGAAFTGPNPQLGEDLSILKGNHQLGFGASYNLNIMNYWSGLNAPGSVSFGGQATGNTLADFLTGQPSSATGNNQVTQGTTSGFAYRQHYIGLYAQDSWKVTPRLTVTYGVRWEPYLAVYSKYGEFSHFDPGLFAAGAKSKVFTNAPAGLIFPGDTAYTAGKSVENNKLLKFGPRLGVVWDPNGDGKMTIRAGYGMFNDRQHFFNLTFISQNQPFGYLLGPPNPTLTDPWINQPGGNPFPLNRGQNSPFYANANVINHPLDAQPTYLNQWNFSIQRQVGTNWLLTANYVGNSTVHLLSSNQTNYGVFMGTGPCTLQSITPAGQVVASPQTVCSTSANLNQRRVLWLQNPLQGQFYSGVPLIDDGGTANYEALFLSVQKRLSQGVSILANYTWSHCISDIYDPQTGAGGASTSAVPGNRSAYHGDCGASDQRHLFNMSIVAQTPTFSNRALRLAVTGWQVSPILRLQSGLPFTVTSGVDTALSGQGGETPNATGANAYTSDRNACKSPPCVAWMSPNSVSGAFSAAAPGTYGNLGYNNFRGPGKVTLDMSLVRSFKVRERATLQFRGEAFNLPNKANFANPGSSLFSTSSFGVITSTGTYDPRIIQLAMKLLF
jgi:hypothetical protein